jgi:ATP-dependent Clp protease protease subunit
MQFSKQNSEFLIELPIELDKKKIDYTSTLLKNRVIFLDSEIDTEVASKIITLLYVLNKEDPTKEIEIWLMSPGGSVDAFCAIYDIMNSIEAPIKTVCIGECCSAAAIILASGTHGLRCSYPNARIMIHQLQCEGLGGSNAEIELNTKELKQINDHLTEILSIHTGHAKAKVKRDTKMDKFMSAKEALEYGLIDQIIEPVKKLPQITLKKE